MGVPREKSLNRWDAVSARHVDVSMSGANLEQQIAQSSVTKWYQIAM